MSRKWNEQTRQNKILICAAAIVLISVISIIVASWIMPRKDSATSNFNGMKINSKPIDAQESIHYQQQVQNFNEQSAAEATASGKTFLSVPIGNPEEINSIAQQPEKLPIYTPTHQTQRNTINADSEKNIELANKDAENILKGLQQYWAYSTPVWATTKDMPAFAKQFQKENLHASLKTNEETTTSNQAQQKIKVLFEAFKLCPASLKTKINTDSNSAIRVKLSCRALYNATLYAPNYKLVGEEVDMTFTHMEFNGNFYKITAKPVDLDTGRTMLTGEVDRRYFSRILIPALALGISKAGSLYENTSKQDTYIDNGTIIQSNSGKVSSKQVNGAFVNGLAQQTANVINADASRMPPIQVTRDDKSTIGIMFISPVLNSDLLDPIETQSIITEPSKTNIIETSIQPVSYEKIEQSTLFNQSSLSPMNQ
ncbi:conjugal transfer protein TraO [Xenorhabdus nematophila]|uniref:conjugal transfer protein TraO n=1 Tax=Xenorhabdus nematophila TaxID=628 RepID=UPI0032B823D2